MSKTVPIQRKKAVKPKKFLVQCPKCGFQVPEIVTRCWKCGKILDS